MLEIEPTLIRSGTALEGYKWKAGRRKDLTSPGLRANPTLSPLKRLCVAAYEKKRWLLVSKLLVKGEKALIKVALL